MPTEAIPRKLLVEIRRADYSRAGQIDERDIVDLKLVLRLNNLGAWSISMPSKSPAATEMQVPGAGIVVTLDGDVLFSGPLLKGTLAQKSGDIDTWTFEGIDDNWALADPLAYPSPASSIATVQPGTPSATGYDVRNGAAETVMRAYVNANVGPSAPAARKIAILDLAPDQGRGPVVRGLARFTPLGELLQSFASLGNLIYRVRANGDRLLFEVTERQDRRALVRFDVDNDTADDASYSFEAPSLTRVIVGGQGEAQARVFIERVSADSRAAEALWGRRIERFVDRRDGDQIIDLQQGGDEALADGGATKVAVTLTPVDTYGAQFWRDWRVGDLVSATVGDVSLEDVVSEATVTYGTDGFSVSAVLGDPTTAARTPLLQLLMEQRRIRTRTGRLERQ